MGGCLYAFNTVYRKNFKDYDINVRHVVEVIHKLEKTGKIKLNSLEKEVIYHDPCRLGRKYEGSLFVEPQDLLKKCG